MIRIYESNNKIKDLPDNMKYGSNPKLDKLVDSKYYNVKRRCHQSRLWIR